MPRRQRRPRTHGPRSAPDELDSLLDLLDTAERSFNYHLKTRVKHDALANRVALERWLVERRHLDASVQLSREDYWRVVQFRDALRDLVVSGRADDPDSMARLQPYAEAARLRIRLDGDPPALEAAEDGLDGVLTTWLWRFVDARREGRWRRVKQCEACGRIFYDHSRPIVAKWCSTRCSDRIRGRSYQRRERRAQRAYNERVRARRQKAQEAEQGPAQQGEDGDS
jgi:predicted RNA-binding Zn ribbon-like protein